MQITPNIHLLQIDLFIENGDKLQINSQKKKKK